MAIFRFSRAPPAVRRWTIGLQWSGDGTSVSAALLHSGGRGLQLRVALAGQLAAAMPPDAPRLLAALRDPAERRPPAEAAAAVAAVGRHLAETAAPLVDGLLARGRVPRQRVLALGVLDGGLWSHDAAGRSYYPLANPALLAERTGLNVIDAFPQRDLSAHGQGGPVEALAQAVLLRHPGRCRALVDLGRTLRVTYLPRDGTGGPPLRAFDIGPGMRLLDLLTARLTGGRQTFDPGGSLAAQGLRLGPLVEHWLAAGPLRQPLPRWNPSGVAAERFLVDAFHLAVQHQWSVRDLLCSATHFLAESVHDALTRTLDHARLDEVVLCGGGQHNGMLRREIARLISGPEIYPLAELGMDDAALGPACAAVLALFYLDQVPANLPEVTGAEVSRVLGRLTPGSPQAWQALLADLAGARPELRPLRSAL